MLVYTYFISEIDKHVQSIENVTNTVDPRYLDFSYLEKPLISRWKSGPCFNTEI